MRLMTFKLERFRRFKDPACIDVSSSVVALVGPNEAGKSSVLRAMDLFNEATAIPESDRTRGLSRGPVLVAGYVLDDDDKEAIASIPGGADVKWWTLEKHSTGRLEAALHPRPQRDLSKRHELAHMFQAFEAEGQVSRLIASIGGGIADDLKAAEAALASDAQSLTGDEEKAIRALGAHHQKVSAVDSDAEAIPTPEEVSTAYHNFLKALASYREGQHPHDQAAQRLIERRPRFLMFGPEDRELLTRYDLATSAGNPPAALANLARLANLDLSDLLQAARKPDHGLRETLIVNANAELRTAFRGAWNQSNVNVHLDMDGTVLIILVSIPGDRLTDFEDRSDGLRTFVALRAFIERFDLSVPPILLIDEAETHLHYDAQADLISVFTTQKFAAKVIYTTHSAGCLPEDLGNGVRAIVPAKQGAVSSVSNNIWAGSGAGVTPLVLAMGATSFAFLPARRVLLAEGLSDAMLYPTLFREATGVDSLAFQVVPGLAAVAPAGVQRLLSEGGTVAFVVDGDAAGDTYCEEFEEAGVPEKIIFSLKRELGDDVEVEDLIDSTHYAKAVNDLLETFQSEALQASGDRVQESDIPPVARTRTIEQWCKAKGVKPPDKTDVAQRLLEMKSEAARHAKELQLPDPQHAEQLKQLVAEINQALGIGPKGSASTSG